MSDVLLLLLMAALVGSFLYRTGKLIVSMVRPDLVARWIPVQGMVRRSESVPDGWHLFMTYSVDSQTYQVDGVVSRESSQPPTITALVYKNQHPAEWDWAEDREQERGVLKETKFVWFWILLVGGLIGILVLIALYKPDLLYKYFGE